MERKRIVVKIGSSSLTNAKGEIDKIRLMDHVQAIAELKNVAMKSYLFHQVQLQQVLSS